MIIFSEDKEILMSILAMMASYSASLLEEGKSKCMACSIISLVEALSCSPRPSPVFREAPSTFRVHQLDSSSSVSCLGIYAKNSGRYLPF